MVEVLESMRREMGVDWTPVCIGGTEISKLDEGDLEDIEIIKPNTLVPDMVIKRNSKKKGRVHHGMMLK
eukprot:6027809-Ditylum_brightwellii.AAC.1